MSKICKNCKENKELSQFRACRGTKDNLMYVCKDCEEKHRSQQMERKKAKGVNYYTLWKNAKDRARTNGVEFSITQADIPVTENCPIFGWKLEPHAGKLAKNSPSLDRRDDSKGYIPGNVRVISFEANRLKNTLTLEEIENLYLYSLNKK